MAFGGTVGRLLVEITGTDVGLQGSLAKARADTDAFATRSGQKMAGFSRAANVAFLAAGAAAVAFAAISVKAYLEHQAVLAKLEATMASMPKLAGASTAAFEKQAMSLEGLTGVEHDQTLAADTVLARFNLTQKQIQQLIPLVLDYSRATGVDAPTAASNLGKALLGNTRALKTIGIQFKATGDTAKDLNTITALLQARVGGLAEAFGKTTAGQIEIFRARLKDVEEVAGKALLPTVNAIVSSLSSLLHVLTPVAAVLPQILLAMLAFRALTFLPTLLGSIGAELGIIGAASGIRGLETAAGGLMLVAEAAQATLVPLAILGGGIYLLIKAGQDQSRAIKEATATIIQYGTATTTGAEAEKTLRDAMVARSPHNVLGAAQTADYTKALQGATAAHSQLAQTIGVTDTELQAFVDQSKAAELAANKQKDAILSLIAANLQLAGGFLGIKGAQLSVRSSQLSLIQAEQKYADDVKHHRQNTLQANQDLLALQQAQLGAVQSQEALASSVVSFAEKQVKAGATTDSITRKVRGFATAAGFTKGQTDALVQSVLDLIGKDKDLPPNVRTQYSAPGLDKTKQEVGAYVQMLKGIPTVIKTYGVFIPAARPGGPIRQAEGGVYAQGGLVGWMGYRPIIAGEGSYQTPFGPGAEVVSPRGAMPLSNRHLDAMASYMAKRMGGSSRPPVHVTMNFPNFAGDPHVLKRHVKDALFELVISEAR